MVNCKTYMIVKALLAYNYIIEILSKSKNIIKNIYFYLKDYFYGHHDMWLFVPGHSVPLPLNKLYNVIHINWIYDNSNNILSMCTDNNMTEYNKYKLSWLSAKVNITDAYDSTKKYEYDLDDFIEKFSIISELNTVPSLYMIFMCWCAYSKHWFKINDHIIFNIINDMGEENIIDLDKYNNSLIIKKNKIYIDTNKVNKITDKTEISDKLIKIHNTIVDNSILNILNKNKNE